MFGRNIETGTIHLMMHGDNFQLVAMPNGIQAQLRILNPSYIRKVSLDDGRAQALRHAAGHTRRG